MILSGFLEYFLLHLKISLVLALTISLAGISYMENANAVSHNFESEWGTAGISKSGLFLSPQHIAIDSQAITIRIITLAQLINVCKTAFVSIRMCKNRSGTALANNLCD